MSAPNFPTAGLPSLPPGWSEHIGPAGQIYYYNSLTRESTYIRPFAPAAVTVQPTQAKKEKAKIKTAIPGTDWLRVTTTEGNVFYSNKVTKQSSWTVPPEIKDAVEALAKQEREAQQSTSVPTEVTGSAAGNVQRKKEATKRKRDEIMPLDEISVSKKAKTSEGGEGDDDEDDDEEDDSDEEDEEEEEEWQREAAEQLAREAEEEKRRKEEEEAQKKEEEEAAKKKEAGKLPQLNMPEKVDLSLDEAKALFKTLLREKDINPLHPWDACLPKFISDPRYVLLPSVNARREAFDEYCRERARELRESTVKKDKQETDPKEEFDRLLQDEVKSTRASWTDFRRQWKKDRRFYGWGRDDKEREKAFRDFLKALGEKKKLAAQKAEVDFFALLKEHPEIKPDSLWKDVKKSRSLYKDPRYDAVGSSSLREELFNTYLKGISSRDVETKSTQETTGSQAQPERESKEARRERALREREEKVKAEQGVVNMGIEKSKMGLNREEGERIFKTLLVDAIRDPQIGWDAAVQQLKIDPRFVNSPLPHNTQVKLFHAHIDHLRSKHISGLHQLLEEKSPSLDTKFSSLPVEEILASLHATKLGYDERDLEDEFNRWQRQRYTQSRQAFDDMLNENSFVEFWGRLGKMGDVTLDQGLKITSEDIGEDDDDTTNKVDMKALAKTVDIGEMVKVLKRDRRYTIFDHIPEEREKWLRSYLSNLSAPKLSVHVS